MQTLTGSCDFAVCLGVETTHPATSRRLFADNSLDTFTLGVLEERGGVPTVEEVAATT
jgi:hypothetical protein